MKKLFLILISAFQLFSFSAFEAQAVQTNLLTFDTRDYGQYPQPSVRITLTLITPNPRTYSGLFIRQQPISKFTDTAGVGYFTNILWGTYRADIAGQPGTSFTLYVGTNTLGTVNAASLATNSAAVPPDDSLLYYSRAQVDALIADIETGSGGVVAPGQSTTIRTNGNVYSVDVTGTLTNNTTGYAASATIAASVTNFISPIHLLTSQPRSGAKSTGNFSSTVVTNSNYLLISQPGTTGVVRRLDMMLDVGADGFANTNLSKINLMVWSDSNLVVNAPASDIFGVRYYAPSNGWRVIKDTTWISSTASDSIVPNTYFTWYYYASLYFPMPFTNGMYAKLTNTSGAAWPNGYIAAQHIDASPLPSEFSRYRLTTFTTNMPISGSTSQFVFSVTGKGQLLAVSMALSNSYGDAIVGFEDSSGFAYVADEVVMKPSGVDDYFGASWGGAQGVFTGHRHGQTSWEYNSTTNSWKENYVHFKDNPLTWTNSLRFYLDSGPIDQGVFTFWMLREL